MATESQINANQANARNSTGPRTEEGKARSARNAQSHGLTSREVVILPGEQPEFDQLLQDLTAEVRPKGTLELMIFNNLVHAAWNQRRCRLLEAGLAAEGRDPLTNPEAAAELNRIERYAARAERSYYRALRELRALQTDRGSRCLTLARQNHDYRAAGRNEPNSPEAIAIPPLADRKEMVRQAKFLRRDMKEKRNVEKEYVEPPEVQQELAQIKEFFAQQRARLEAR